MRTRSRIPSAVPVSLAALLAACSEASPPAGAAPRFNVVMISLDTCRADALSCYGAERPNTPAIDALAEESILFEDCLAQSCVTAPSHMSLFTGMYVHRHGLGRNGERRFPPVTLASSLREAGWRTAAFTGHGSMRRIYGLGVGFEVFESWKGPLEFPYTRNLAESAGDAVAWLDALGPERSEPFFLFVHGYDPHSPYTPPEPWLEEYAGWYSGSLRVGNISNPGEFHRLIKDGTIRETELSYIADLYEAEVASADEAVGDLMEALRTRGLLDDTFVVFLSDHGEALGNRDRIGHGEMMNEILQVPLLVRFPRGEPRGTCAAPVELVDLAPTLLGALGLEVSEGMQGRDLRPVLADEKGASWHGRLRISEARASVSVRLGDFKADFYLTEQGVRRQKLFDIRSDPLEARNLYPLPEHQARFEGMAGRYGAWRSENAEEDERFLGPTEPGGQLADEIEPQDEFDDEILRALGYAGEDED